MDIITKHLTPALSPDALLPFSSHPPQASLNWKRARAILVKFGLAIVIFTWTRFALQRYLALYTSAPMTSSIVAVPKPGKVAPVRRIAVFDSSGGGNHDEVQLPLVWSLTTVTSARIDLYHNTFREGSQETLEQLFSSTNNTIHPLDAFWDQDFSDVELIVLPTGEADAPALIKSGILLAHPHIKVMSVAHGLWFWTEAWGAWSPLATRNLQEVAYHVETGRWTLLTLSPHVARIIQKEFSKLPGWQEKEFPLPETFVPIRPVARVYTPFYIRNKQFQAAIVGSLNTSRRNYYRIFELLSNARSRDPEDWTAVDSRSQGSNAEALSAFKLSLLGRPNVDSTWKGVPESLSDLVEETHKEITEASYHRDIASSDVVIPACADKRHYTVDSASGAFPAALMARVPVLVDEAELSAYSYLKPPAYILRNEGEDEIQAIARLRRLRQVEPLDELAEQATRLAWEEYENQIYRSNRLIFSRVLQATPEVPMRQEVSDESLRV